MNSLFSDREKAFEDKWAHDEELRFKVLARRDRLLGLWAAEERGLGGENARDYAETIVETRLAKGSEKSVFERVKADFAASGVARTDHLIRRKMDEFLATAKNEVMNGS